jgi:hypothetical protein
MARLDAILGRGADAARPPEGDKGSNKGSPTIVEANERPDPRFRLGRKSREWYRIPDSNR